MRVELNKIDRGFEERRPLRHHTAIPSNTIQCTALHFTFSSWSLRTLDSSDSRISSLTLSCSDCLLDWSSAICGTRRMDRHRERAALRQSWRGSSSDLRKIRLHHSVKLHRIYRFLMVVHVHPLQALWFPPVEGELLRSKTNDSDRTKDRKNQNIASSEGRMRNGSTLNYLLQMIFLV